MTLLWRAAGARLPALRTTGSPVTAGLPISCAKNGTLSRFLLTPVRWLPRELRLNRELPIRTVPILVKLTVLLNRCTMLLQLPIRLQLVLSMR